MVLHDDIMVMGLAALLFKRSFAPCGLVALLFKLYESPRAALSRCCLIFKRGPVWPFRVVPPT